MNTTNAPAITPPTSSQPETIGEDVRRAHAISHRPAVLAWIRLMRVFHKIERATGEQLRCHGLSLSRFDLINQIGAGEGRTQQELADSLLVTKGNIPQLLDPLEREGLVERRKCGRCNRVYLTDAGQTLRARVLDPHEALIAERMSALTPEEQQTLLALLRKLDHALEEPAP
jgi:DNA-binding MarR family transcriptional regulator